jgi:hypothetical protein
MSGRLGCVVHGQYWSVLLERALRNSSQSGLVSDEMSMACYGRKSTVLVHYWTWRQPEVDPVTFDRDLSRVCPSMAERRAHV